MLDAFHNRFVELWKIFIHSGKSSSRGDIFPDSGTGIRLIWWWWDILYERKRAKSAWIARTKAPCTTSLSRGWQRL
jgi:hypothetical protein